MADDKNALYYGDNLDILRDRIADESVDLIYLDPPFNSNRSYNVLFRTKGGDEAQAQIEAFDDTWTWSQQSEAEYEHLTQGGAAPSVADAIEAMRKLLGDNDVLAYLVMMTARLVQLRRVLKPTGSIYLHCDPTASHYLKVMLDAIFGKEQFRNEIIWRRTGAHTTPRRFETIHDTIFFYAGPDAFFQPIKTPYTAEHVRSRYSADPDGRLRFVTGGNILTGPGVTGGESGQPWKGFDPTARGRHWAVPSYLAEQMPEGFGAMGVIDRLDALFDAGLVVINEGAAWPHPVKYLDESDGQFVADIWAYQPGTEGTLHGTTAGIDADVQWLGPTTPERLGYPTQKPVGLLERIINTSSKPGDVVLDPFCGCGTTITAAQRLDRRWKGIDISYLSVALIQERLTDEFGTAADFEVVGIPRDLAGAQALFKSNAFDFERWAVTAIGGRANEKQVGDKGTDGVIRFPLDKTNVGRIVISVKGGTSLNPAMVRDLRGTVEREKAAMGVLLTLVPPTKGMIDEVNASGRYTYDLTGTEYPKLQLISVPEILAGKRLNCPAFFLAYTQAKKLIDPMDQTALPI